MSKTIESVSVGITGYALLRRVIENSRAPLATRAVAMYLAINHNADLGYAFPSRENIANQLRISTRQVDRHVSILVELGEWAVWSGFGGMRDINGKNAAGRANRYFPTESLLTGVEVIPDPEEPEEDPTLEEPETSTDDPEESATISKPADDEHIMKRVLKKALGGKRSAAALASYLRLADSELRGIVSGLTSKERTDLSLYIQESKTAPDASPVPFNAFFKKAIHSIRHQDVADDSKNFIVLKKKFGGMPLSLSRALSIEEGESLLNSDTETLEEIYDQARQLDRDGYNVVDTLSSSRVLCNGDVEKWLLHEGFKQPRKGRETTNTPNAIYALLYSPQQTTQPLNLDSTHKENNHA